VTGVWYWVPGDGRTPQQKLSGYFLTTNSLAPITPMSYKQPGIGTNEPMYKIIGGDQKEYGPVTADELRRWLAEGRLNGQSQAQAEGSAEWRPLASFPEFAEALRAQAGASAPPPGGPMPPASAQLWTAQLLATPPQVQVGRCLALSWKLLTANFGLLFAATFLVWMIGTVCGLLPFGGLFYWIFRGVFYGALYLIFLNRIRGRPASVGDVFDGFKTAFAQLVLVGLISSLLTGIGFVCCLVIPGLYLYVAWTFSVPLVSDRQMEFWSAMELSRKVVTRVWFEIFALVLLAFLPSILMYVFIEVKISMSMASMFRDLMTSSRPDFARILSLSFQMARSSLPLVMLWKFVVLLNLPFALGALMYAYENLFGTRTTPAA